MHPIRNMKNFLTDLRKSCLPIDCSDKIFSAASVMPLITVLGYLSLLIATLSTVDIFFRMRTASLAEIQLRLATLEDMLASQPDSEQSSNK